MPQFNPTNIPKNPNARPGQALNKNKVMQGGSLASHPNPNMGAVFSAPVPGQSLTHAPKSMAWEKPPQHTDLEKVMVHLMHQLTEQHHLKHLLGLLDGGMAIEAIARTILFAGFTQGQWSPDLAMLMYKPLMLSLMAIAHRAGMKDAPVVTKETMDKHMLGQFKRNQTFANAKSKAEADKFVNNKISEQLPEPPSNAGFMTRNT